MTTPTAVAPHAPHRFVQHHDPEAAALALATEAEAQKRELQRRRGIRDRVYLAGRVALGAMFLWTGLEKALAFDEATYALGQVLAGERVYVGIATAMELLGGLALVLGWRVRQAAVGLIVYVLLANGLVQLADPLEAGGPLAVTNLGFVGGLLLLVAHGAGIRALDGRERAR